MVEIKQNLVKESNYSKKCPYEMKPQFIVVHNTANDASAANEISYMISNTNTVSFHYAVDDKEIVQGIPLNRNTWNAGDGTTGKGNRYGISIEICYSKSGGERFEKAVENSTDLVAYLLNKYGWDASKITKHQDYNGKHCPHRILDEYGWDKYVKLCKTKLEALQKPATSTTTKTTTTTSTSKTTSTATSTGSVEKVVAGSAITLNNTNIYASATAKTASGKKTGTFYIWSAEINNNRVRVTNSKANVGKNGQVTGFVNISDVKSATTTTTATKTTTTTSSTTFKKGDAIKIASGATYTTGAKVPLWVRATTCYVLSVNKDGSVVFSTKKNGAITGAVPAKYVTKK